MKEDIKQFLASSLLEEYVLGSIDPNRIEEVEEYIRRSTEVKSAYEDLQNNIELLAKKVATPPPPGTKENILREIDRTIDASKASRNYGKWWLAAAILAAVAFGIWSILLSQKNATLQAEKNTLEENYVTLQEQCEAKQLLYAQEEAQWKMLAAATTQKFLLNGNEKASNLKTVAYRNEENQASYLHILSLPILAKGKCLQLWADVNGEMVSIKILPKEAGQIVAIPFQENATSLNITIEPEGGSAHPTIANLVGNVSI